MLTRIAKPRSRVLNCTSAWEHAQVKQPLPALGCDSDLRKPALSLRRCLHWDVLQGIANPYHRAFVEGQHHGDSQRWLSSQRLCTQATLDYDLYRMQMESRREKVDVGRPKLESSQDIRASSADVSKDETIKPRSREYLFKLEHSKPGSLPTDAEASETASDLVPRRSSTWGIRRGDRWNLVGSPGNQPIYRPLSYYCTSG